MARTAKVEFFKSKNKKWRWRLRASNGRVICNPGEDFSGRSKAKKNFLAVLHVLHGRYHIEGLEP